MSEYVARQLRIVNHPTMKINLARRINPVQPILCEGFMLPGFRVLSLPALRRAKVVNKAAQRTGVYFLWDEDRLMYIGSSETIWWRIKWHVKKSPGSFNYATYLAIDFPWYLSIEAAYIRAYLPPWNKDHCPPPPLGQSALQGVPR